MTPNATASRQRFSRLMLRWPLSQLLTYVRSRPASSARASWDKPASRRNCRSLLPNRCFARSACLCITMDAPIVGRMRSASPRTLRHVAQMRNNVLRERAADGDAQNGGGGAPERREKGRVARVGVGLDRGSDGVYMRLTRPEIPSRLAEGAPNACVNDSDGDAV